jgi:fumagillin biosynthesis methyltransferase
MTSDLKETIATLDSIQPDAFHDESARIQVAAAVRRLTARLQTPFERAWELSYESPGVFAAVQTALDVGVFETWLGAGGRETSLEDLVGFCKSKVDPNLLSMLLHE